jgi:hypothetical protein
MLRQIDEAFKDRSNSLYTATMNRMHQLSSIARQLRGATAAWNG